jgi:hypothetical protein
MLELLLLLLMILVLIGGIFENNFDGIFDEILLLLEESINPKSTFRFDRNEVLFGFEFD